MRRLLSSSHLCTLSCSFYHQQEGPSKASLSLKERIKLEKESLCQKEASLANSATEGGDVEIDNFVQQKETIAKSLSAARHKKLRTREDFLDWQAGQREMGAATRLKRKAKKAQGHRAHTTTSKKDRINTVAYVSSLGENTNNNASDYLRRGQLPRSLWGRDDEMMLVQSKGGVNSRYF